MTQEATPGTGAKSPDKEDIDKPRKVAFKDLGGKMPLGIPITDGYARDIVVRPWRMKEERELGALRDANRDNNMAQYVGMVLSTLCSKMGHHNFDDMKMAEKQLVVGQMFMGDVFFVYIWLRIQTLGNELKLKLTCPTCGKKFDYMADLGTVEVTIADDVNTCKWDYTLKHPFKLRNKDVSKLILGPARWNGMEMMNVSGQNMGEAKNGIIQGSICAIPDWKDDKGEPQAIALGPDELDELSKFDLERLTTLIDEHALGPSMAVEDKCGSCHKSFTLPIDWSYDSFFGDSSR